MMDMMDLYVNTNEVGRRAILFIENVTAAHTKHKHHPIEMSCLGLIELIQDLKSICGCDPHVEFYNLMCAEMIANIKAEHIGGSWESYTDRLNYMEKIDGINLDYKLSLIANRKFHEMNKDIDWSIILGSSVPKDDNANL